MVEDRTPERCRLNCRFWPHSVIAYTSRIGAASLTKGLCNLHDVAAARDPIAPDAVELDH
jgi:hypothetical protein